MNIVRGIFVALTAFVIVCVLRLGAALYRSRSLPPAAHERATSPGPIETAVGFVTNFFDTLGIGSFATTTTIYKLLKLVPDERIPGTMIVGLIAVWLVKSLPLDVVRWGVIVVVVYTALTLMRSAADERRGRQPVPEVAAV